jgi:hypothetical protein
MAKNKIVEKQSPILVSIKNHLEFMAYEVKFLDPNIILAESENTYDKFISDMEITRCIAAIFNLSDYALLNSLELVTIVNKINATLPLIRCVIRDDSLFFECFYDGEYNKKRFGEFFKLFEDILDEILEDVEELEKFIE